MSEPRKRIPQNTENSENNDLKARIEELERTVIMLLNMEKEKEKDYESEYVPAGTYLGVEF